jgi:soluble lytic murein transglycosylase-like protein
MPGYRTGRAMVLALALGGASLGVLAQDQAPDGLLASFEVSLPYKAVRPWLREAAAETGVDYELLKAVVATESGFDPKAVSHRGAIGLMQLIPDTAVRFGVKAKADATVAQQLTDPRTNIRAGARYLAWLLRRFDGRTELALAAYNAGEGAVDRAGRRIPPYPETRHYVSKVTRLQAWLTPPQEVQRWRAATAAQTPPVPTTLVSSAL